MQDQNMNQNQQPENNNQFNNYQSENQNGYTEYYNAPYGQPTYTPQPRKVKKEKKPLGRGAVTAAIAVSLVLSLLVGAGGGVLAARYFGGGSAGSTVLYKSVELQDQNGDAITEQMSVNEVVQLNQSSVVEITTEQVTTGQFMMQYISQGAGSGVIISEDGYIVTNFHVIEDATNISVKIDNEHVYTAKIIGADEQSDLAVLKIDATGLSPASFGESAGLEIGDQVVAIGNPLGQLGGTVTSGIISALDREITIDNQTMTLLQTDTAINPGNSGGGLFNLSGQLVGIVNAKSSGTDVEGLGFAIPIDTAKPIIEDLIEHGYVTGRVELGITIIDISDEQTALLYRVSEPGLYIYSVNSGSAASEAGLQSGDRIISINGTEVENKTDFTDELEKYSVGEVITLRTQRGSNTMDVNVTLRESGRQLGNTSTNQSQDFGLGDLFR